MAKHSIGKGSGARNELSKKPIEKSPLKKSGPKLQNPLKGKLMNKAPGAGDYAGAHSTVSYAKHNPVKGGSMGY